MRWTPLEGKEGKAEEGGIGICFPPNPSSSVPASGEMSRPSGLLTSLRVYSSPFCWKKGVKREGKRDGSWRDSAGVVRSPPSPLPLPAFASFLPNHQHRSYRISR